MPQHSCGGSCQPLNNSCRLEPSLLISHSEARSDCPKIVKRLRFPSGANTRLSGGLSVETKRREPVPSPLAKCRAESFENAICWPSADQRKSTATMSPTRRGEPAGKGNDQYGVS